MNNVHTQTEVVAAMTTALQAPECSAVALTGVTSSRNQTLTLIAAKHNGGAIDLMSEREGSTWRRSITIEPNNLPLLIAALTKMAKALKGNHPVAIAVIRNGAIE